MQWEKAETVEVSVKGRNVGLKARNAASKARVAASKLRDVASKERSAASGAWNADLKETIAANAETIGVNAETTAMNAETIAVSAKTVAMNAKTVTANASIANDVVDSLYAAVDAVDASADAADAAMNAVYAVYAAAKAVGAVNAVLNGLANAQSYTRSNASDYYQLYGVANVAADAVRAAYKAPKAPYTSYALGEVVTTVEAASKAAATVAGTSLALTARAALEYDVKAKLTPHHIYRSLITFLPPSSELRRCYEHLLDDSIELFSISGEVSGRSIPLSQDATSSRNAMQVKLNKMREEVPSSDEEPDYEAELLDDDICGGIVACASLSRDGSCIALGFGSGAIEIVNVNRGRMVSRFQCDARNPPAWIEFVHDCRIATQDNKGNVTIFGRDIQKLDSLPIGPYPAVTAVS